MRKYLFVLCALLIACSSLEKPKQPLNTISKPDPQHVSSSDDDIGSTIQGIGEAVAGAFFQGLLSSGVI